MLFKQQNFYCILLLLGVMSRSPEFTRKLPADKIIEDSDSVQLECQTNLPDSEVIWEKDKQQIVKEHVKISQQGCIHTLGVERATIVDEGEYTCRIKDTNTTTSCWLTVKGMDYVYFITPACPDYCVFLSVFVSGVSPPTVFV